MRGRGSCSLALLHGKISGKKQWDMLININNCPTRCNTKQSIYYSASSLYMFRVPITPIIRSTQNYNCSLRYWSYFLCSYLHPTWPTQDHTHHQEYTKL